MFIATLFVIAQNWKKKMSSVDQQINKWWCFHITEYCSFNSRNKLTDTCNNMDKFK